MTKKNFENISTEELVLYTQQHQECQQEMDELYERFKNMVHKVVQAHLKHESQDYEDCVQQGYVLLLECLGRFDASKEVPFSQYFYRSFRWYILRYMPTLKSKYDSTETMAEFFRGIEDNTFSIDDSLYKENAKEFMMSFLTESEKTDMNLWLAQSSKEVIESTTKRSVSSYYNRLIKIKQKIREHLDASGINEDNYYLFV